MPALILRLVLVATLALNGFGAPMAMAHDMGAPPQDAASSATAPEALDVHAAHHHDGSLIPAAGAVPAEATTGGCCEDALCTCGCILPPALPFVFAIQFRHAHAPQPPAIDACATAFVAMTAPFRPPAAC